MDEQGRTGRARKGLLRLRRRGPRRERARSYSKHFHRRTEAFMTLLSLRAANSILSQFLANKSLLLLESNGIGRSERPCRRRLTVGISVWIVHFTEPPNLPHALDLLVLRGHIWCKHVAQICTSRIFRVEIAPSCVITLWKSAGNCIIDEQWRGWFSMWKCIASGDGAQTALAFFWVRERRLQITHAIKRRIPSEMCMPKDVHGGLQLVNSRGQI
mmetsp:Transcript_36888/g.61100  ORF Transcript_36888/g.61100 Transcript_36888/m.61100 type:complete len:215 (+) Transcript_36888:153-797(+)